MYKAYSDGSTKDGRSGIGYIIYKDDRVVFRCRKQSEIHNSDELEYIALTELLKTINLQNLRNVEVNIDCKNITDKLELIGSNKKIKNKRMKDIIYEIKSNPSICVNRINSNKNKAHKVSREAMQGKPDLEENDLPSLKHTPNSVNAIRNSIKYNRRLFLRCHCCKEIKSRVKFPKRKNQGICSMCKVKMKSVESAYYKVKNTY